MYRILEKKISNTVIKLKIKEWARHIQQMLNKGRVEEAMLTSGGILKNSTKWGNMV